MKLKFFFREFLLIIFEGFFAAIGGYLIFNKHLYSGLLSFASFVIINIILSHMKQPINIYGTSFNPPHALNYPKGTVYYQYKK